MANLSPNNDSQSVLHAMGVHSFSCIDDMVRQIEAKNPRKDARDLDSLNEQEATDIIAQRRINKEITNQVSFQNAKQAEYEALQARAE
jgi:hypothetical protein